MDLQHEKEFDKPIFKYFRGKWKEIGNEKNESSPDTNKSEFIITPKDLSTKSVAELEDLMYRQKKLVNNKAFISKLRDKGKKIYEKYEELERALEIARRVTKSNEGLSNGLTNGNISNDINHLEWSGTERADAGKKFSQKSPQRSQKVITEDETNPLQLLARHSVEYPPQSKISQETAESSPPVEAVLEELERLDIASGEKKECTLPSTAKSYQNDKPADQNSKHTAQTIYKSYEHKDLIARQRFKTNRPIEKSSDMKENSDTSKSNSSKIITLEESLKLLAEVNMNVKTRMIKETELFLKETRRTNHASSVPQYHNYRDKNATHHLLEEFEEEKENDFVLDRLSDEEEGD